MTAGLDNLPYTDGSGMCFAGVALTQSNLDPSLSACGAKAKSERLVAGYPHLPNSV